MKRVFAILMVAVALSALMITGCGSAAPAPPTPTKAPAAAAPAAAPTKAPVAAPTKAPAAQPTAAPAPKATYPEKGKSITFLVPYPAGGGTDITSRILVPYLEKELGTSINIVNKGGAASQVGLTELAQMKPDGYSIGRANLPAFINIYADASRKSVVGRKDLVPLANVDYDTGAIAVKTASPIKDVKDLIAAAKDKPRKVSLAAQGVLSWSHLAALQIGELAGVEFSVVQFDGVAPSVTAMLGGHVDGSFGTVGDFTNQVKSGQVRLIAVLDKEENQFARGIPTLAAQGYKVFFNNFRMVVAPAGIPNDVKEVLMRAIGKVLVDESFKKKMNEAGFDMKILTIDQLNAEWDEYDKLIRDLIELAKQKEKQK